MIPYRSGSLKQLNISLLLFFLTAQIGFSQAWKLLDIANLNTGEEGLLRLYGSEGLGNLGVPVSNPGDLDGDGFADVAAAFIQASPLGRNGAGEVDVYFGKGHVIGAIDTAQDQPSLLRIFGDVNREVAGAEVWIGDVTGDGIADLLVGRQNYSPPGPRIGTGALTIVVGSPALRTFAATQQPLDLRQPPGELTIFTIVGRATGDRLGIWMRTGDVDGDGIADMVVGADQEEPEGESLNHNSGAIYVVRGGQHLSSSTTVDLGDDEDTTLDGHILRLSPPPGSERFHTGGTCLIADLDGNGKGEVLAAAALNRGGASISPAGASTAQATGGGPDGIVYIAWDDNFPASPWSDEDLDLTNLPATQSIIQGGILNVIFGEEMVGGLDFDGDGVNDLFVGDFGAAGFIGVGYVIYNAAQLKGQQFTLDDLPEGMKMTAIQGTNPGSISADTAAIGDFDGDGLGDLAYGSPHADPQERDSAGTVHIFFGQVGGWPEFVNTAFGNLPPSDLVRVTEIHGARGRVGADRGDTLCYSAAAGDFDGDGLDDFITNEMTGNGPSSVDVGNLIVLSGQVLSSAASPILLAQFGSGNVVSEILINNPAATLSKAGKIRFYDDDGLPLPTQVSVNGSLDPALAGVVPVDEIDFFIAPLGRVSVLTVGGEPSVGSAVISANGTLGAVIRFEIPGTGIAGVPASPPMAGFVAPVRAENGIDTGIAFMNPTDHPITVSLNVLNSFGEVVGEPDVLVELPARGHLARFVTQLFEGTIALPFAGSLLARVLDGTVAAVAVELGTQKGEFTTLVVTPLEASAFEN